MLLHKSKKEEKYLSLRDRFISTLEEELEKKEFDKKNEKEVKEHIKKKFEKELDLI